MRTFKKAFTLIELLVVISIIALLLGILLPSLSSARDLARKAKCQAQMRQLAIAIRLYAASNGDALPYYCLAWSNNGPLNGDNSYRWYHRIASYIGEGSKSDQVTAVTKVRKCPAGKRAEDFPDMYGRWSGWIGANYDGGIIAKQEPVAPFYMGHMYSGNTLRYTNPPMLLANMKNPSAWLMLMDCQIHEVFSPARSIWNVDSDGDGMPDTNHIYPVGRGIGYNCAAPKIHRNGANVALADGHIEWVAFKELWEYDQQTKKAAHPYWYPSK